MAEVNIAAVLIANLMAMTMLFIILINRHWRLDRRVRESDALYALVVRSFISWVIDCVSNLVAGRPGVLCCVVGYATNTWLYAMNVVVGSLWLTFLTTYLHVKLPSWYRKLCTAGAVILLAILVLNLFEPVCFYFESNVYHRGVLYPLYTGVSIAFLLASVVVYCYARKQGGMLKFFPVWVFMIPAIMGICLQAVFYGVSTIWPFLAIAVSGVMSGLQNELIFRDKLTGLYNRFYLDDLKGRVSEYAEGRFTIVMMDLDGFKAINDNYGHAVGDKALEATGAVLSDAVGTLGTVMRYAGDEFVALLNTQDTEAVEACVQRIYQGLNQLNNRQDIPYHVSLSLGHCPFDLSVTTVDEALNRVDQLMYANKRTFYQNNPSFDRRAAR